MQKTAKGKRGAKPTTQNNKKETASTRNKGQTLKLSQLNINPQAHGVKVGTKVQKKIEEKTQQKQSQAQKQIPTKQQKKVVNITIEDEIEEDQEQQEPQIQTKKPQKKTSNMVSKRKGRGRSDNSNNNSSNTQTQQQEESEKFINPNNSTRSQSSLRRKSQNSPFIQKNGSIQNKINSININGTQQEIQEEIQQNKPTRTIKKLNFDFESSSEDEGDGDAKKQKQCATMIFFKKNDISPTSKDSQPKYTILAKSTDEKYPPLFTNEFIKQESARKSLLFYRMKSRCLTLDNLNSISIGPDNKLQNLLDIKSIQEGSSFNQIVEYEKNFLQKNVVKKKISCNCKKTKCLKLYCDCFAQGEYCKDCNCTDCHNTEEYQDEREQAMNQLEQRNPSAFRPKVQVKEDEEESEQFVNNKGCNCKKSGCQKKYCECYNTGVKCSDLCKCEGCKNRDANFLLQNTHSKSNNNIKEEYNTNSNAMNNITNNNIIDQNNINNVPKDFQNIQRHILPGIGSSFFNQLPQQSQDEDNINNTIKQEDRYLYNGNEENSIGMGNKSKQFVLGNFNVLSGSQDNNPRFSQQSNFNFPNFQTNLFQTNTSLGFMDNGNNNNNDNKIKNNKDQQQQQNIYTSFMMPGSNMFLDGGNNLNNNNNNENSNRSQSQGFINISKSKNSFLRNKVNIIEKQDDDE